MLTPTTPPQPPLRFLFLPRHRNILFPPPLRLRPLVLAHSSRLAGPPLFSGALIDHHPNPSAQSEDLENQRRRDVERVGHEFAWRVGRAGGHEYDGGGS